MSEFVDTYIRVEEAEGKLYSDVRDRVWRLVAGGELRALMSSSTEPVVGDVIDLWPWRG